MNCDFSKRLEIMMSQKGVSQPECAKSADIPLATLRNLLYNAKTPPRADIACKLARYLGTTVEHLVFGDSYDEHELKLGELDEKLSKIESDIQELRYAVRALGVHSR